MIDTCAPSALWSAPPALNGCWIQLAVKHRRRPLPELAVGTVESVGPPNPVTGKPALGPGYAVATIAHSETVLRGFYDFQRDVGAGPILNPFPLDIARRSERANAHHNPMDAWKHDRVGRYRPKVPQRIPRAIPDDRFNMLFGALPSNRDRALVAFWISTGARASELLGMRQCDVDPGQQLITVVRKGSRAMQQLPAAGDAFVWLRLYQEELVGNVPRGRTQPLWWTPPTTVAAVELSRRPSNVRASQRRARFGLDPARSTPQRGDAHGARPAAGVKRRAMGTRSRAPDHDGTVLDADQRGSRRRGAGAPCAAGRTARSATAGTRL